MPTPDLLQQISGMIKRGRVKKTWNQTQLATHAGVSYTVVQGIEQGLRAPNVRTVMLLFKALDIEPVLTAHDLETASPLLLAPEEAAPEPVSTPQPEEDESASGLATAEEDRIYAEAFRSNFPDPEHIAARTFLEEHPEMSEAVRRHQQAQELTAPLPGR